MLAYVGTRGDNLTAKLTNAGFSGDNLADRLSTLENIGESRYDSVQVSVRRSQSRGLTYLASYTLSWAKDNVPTLYPGSATRGAAVTDVNDLSKDYGYADNDSRHRFTLAATWELPWARDNAILGGWSLNGVYTFQSGTPMTAYATGGGPLRADQNGDPNNGPRTSDEWFDTSVFSAPAAGVEQGSADRNSVRTPGINTWTCRCSRSSRSPAAAPWSCASSPSTCSTTRSTPSPTRCSTIPTSARSRAPV